MTARTLNAPGLKRTWSSIFETGLGARIYPYLMVLPAVIIVLGVVVYPVISGVVSSFYDVTLRTLNNGTVTFVGMRNFQRVFADPVFVKASVNTLIWVVLNVVAQLGLGLALALLLHRAMPGIGFFRSGILVPWVVPSVVAVLTWRWMYDPSVGIVNEMLMKLGIISDYHPWLGDTATSLYAVTVESIWKGTPFVMLLLLAALQLVPRSILEAASMDGTSGWRKLWYVILPQIRVSFAIAAVLTFILTVNNFNAIWLMTEGGPLNSSEILFTLAYKYGFQRFDLGMASAVATMLFVGLVIATTLYLKLIQAREGD
ncbi:carbohydrate ABC transporter permease [Chelatococcus asaccharovorans]|uniref:carbohydrate ABC transporter permease n=1 Tax=Chelatococcus asaccharovorans TaxID=28210 RepID=UPI00224C65FA|nr:sugar ABC transporter permease [Chelatococcus asaccharovorans]CAH1656763.1 Carbohydrate ABC transporter membrane protein 1 (CUT1 family) [Chelatococcus asaccharovorans]CAH1684997.1 Carbohydrate ABC transporter membrane protein 1 (CUT1 family) [Chelatococcus asaccharovorans]